MRDCITLVNAFNNYFLEVAENSYSINENNIDS
jgi:hypothetical protein